MNLLTDPAEPVAPVPVTLTAEQRDLVDNNLRLVYHVAKKRRSLRPEAYEDLILRLYYRLCLCAVNFDPGRGFKFSTYAIGSMEGEAKNYFRDDIWPIKAPRMFREEEFAAVVDSAGDELSLAEQHGENPDKVRTALQPLSLHALLDRSSEEGGEGIDLLADPEDIEARVVSELGGQQLTQHLVSLLQPEEQLILELQMEGGGLTEIEEAFRISKSAAALVWGEIQDKCQVYYFEILEGRWPAPSEGCQALTAALKRKFVAPEMDPFELRRALLAVPDELEVAS